MPRLRIQIAEVYVENEPYKEPNSVGDGLSKVFLKMIGLWSDYKPEKRPKIDWIRQNF